MRLASPPIKEESEEGEWALEKAVYRCLFKGFTYTDVSSLVLSTSQTGPFVILTSRKWADVVMHSLVIAIPGQAILSAFRRSAITASSASRTMMMSSTFQPITLHSSCLTFATLSCLCMTSKRLTMHFVRWIINRPLFSIVIKQWSQRAGIV